MGRVADRGIATIAAIADGYARMAAFCDVAGELSERYNEEFKAAP